MPPWAKKESDSSARLFVIIQTFFVSGKFNAQNKPAAPVPTIITYEVVYDETIPEKVAINEAVELAKKYCDVSASKFVNALLAKLVKKEESGNATE